MAICAICCICLIGTTYATDNGFYDQPYPHGITPIGGVSEDGCFNFVDPDGGIGWAQYKQRELVPQDEIDQIPTTELVRSLIKEKDFMNHLSGLGSDHEDWYMEVFNFTYNSFYEMLRRDDLSEALVEVYCSTSVPTKVEDKNFVVGAAIEELMVIDQEQNGLYDEDLRSKLQTAFWEKNPTRAIYSLTLPMALAMGSVNPVDPVNFIGLDYSSHELYVSSDGETPGFPKPYYATMKQLAREQRKLAHMQKGSSNYKKQRRKVALVHEKVSNQRKDFLHKQAKQIANVYDCVCVESLNMEQQGRMCNWGKTVHDNGWGSFLLYLDYKLKAQGKQLVKIDKWFPSSKLCHVCGYKNMQISGMSGLKIRGWVCPVCGTYHDRDVNAAINIKVEGMRMLGK